MCLIWNGRFSLSRGSVNQSVGEEGAEGAIEDRRQQKIVRSGDCFGDLSHLSPAFKCITGTVGVSQFDKQFLQTSSGQLPLCVWPMTATALEPSQVDACTRHGVNGFLRRSFSLPVRAGSDFACGTVHRNGQPQASGRRNRQVCDRTSIFHIMRSSCCAVHMTEP